MNQTVSEIICSWPVGVPFCARTAISDCTHTLTHDELFEFAVEECLDKIEHEGAVELSTFLCQFPEIADRLLPFLSVMPECTDRGWPRIGESVEGHKILRLLSVSTNSHVYLAEDEYVGGRPTVLKISAKPTNEAVYLARMSHPCVCALYQSSKDSSHLYLKYTAGPNGSLFLGLREKHLGDHLPVLNNNEYLNRILTAFECVASAIDHIHVLGVAHNDIKPSNIVFGDSSTVLVDFDAASEVGVHGARRPLGTVEYLSNESLVELSRTGQLLSQNCIHDDHFAFTLMCFEMLTGLLPGSGRMGEVTTATCEGILKERICLAANKSLAEFMPAGLLNLFVNVITSSAPPLSPQDLVRLIRHHFQPSSIASEQPREVNPNLCRCNPVSTQQGVFHFKLMRVSRVLMGVTFFAVVPLLALTLLVAASIHFSGHKRDRTPPSAFTTSGENRTHSPVFSGLSTPSLIAPPSSSVVNDSGLSPRDAAMLAFRNAMYSNEYEVQIRLYEHAISKGRGDAIVWNNYGFSLLCARRPIHARSAFLTSIRLDPELPQPYIHLAKMDHAFPGKYGAAQSGESTLNAIRRFPSDLDVRMLARSAVQSLSESSDGTAVSRDKARLISEILSNTSHLPLNDPASPIVDPLSHDNSEQYTDAVHVANVELNDQ